MKAFKEYGIKTIKFVTKYSVILALIAIMSIPVIYYLANEQMQTTSDHPLFDSFSTQQYKSIKKNLDSSRLSLLYGKDKEEIIHFVDHYAHQKSKKFQIKKWDSKLSEDLNKYIPIGLLKKTIEEYIDWENDGKSIWIIQLNNQNDQIPQLLNLISLYPEDSFILISNQKIKIPKFKSYEVPDLTQKQFYIVLAKRLKITQKSAQILTDYFGSVSKTIQSTNPEQFNLNDLLKGNLKTWKKQHNDVVRLKLKKLCQNGKIQSKKTIPGFQSMGAFFYEGSYYWRNPQSVLNYKLLTQTSQCKFQLLDISESQIFFEQQEQEQQQKVEAKPQKKEKPKKETYSSDQS